MKPEFGPISHLPIKDPQNTPALPEADLEILSLTVGDVTVLIPKKELYDINDFGTLIDERNPTTIRNKFNQARITDPTIKVVRGVVGSDHRKIFFNESALKKSLAAYMERGDGRNTRKNQPPTFSQVIPVDSSKHQLDTSIFEEYIQDPEKDIMKGKEPIDIKKLKIQILRKSTLYMLFNLAERTNRNIRVILGQFLPPNITLPDVFLDVPDADLKKELLKFTKFKLETSWNKKPNELDVGAPENEIEDVQFGVLSRRFKNQGHSPKTIVNDVSRKIIAYAPRQEEDF